MSKLVFLRCASQNFISQICIEIWGCCTMGRESSKLLVEKGLVKLHDSYFAYNKNIWQDVCLLLGMWIRISISLLVLPKILCRSHDFKGNNRFLPILCVYCQFSKISRARLHCDDIIRRQMVLSWYQWKE